MVRQQPRQNRVSRSIWQTPTHGLAMVRGCSVAAAVDRGGGGGVVVMRGLKRIRPAAVQRKTTPTGPSASFHVVSKRGPAAAPPLRRQAALARSAERRVGTGG